VDRSFRSNALEPVHVLVKNILRATPSQPFVIPNDKKLIHAMLLKLANRIQELEKEQNVGDYDNYISGFRDESTEGDTNAPETSTIRDEKKTEEDEDIEALTNEIAQMAFETPKDVHFGENGNMMMFGTAMNHGRELNGSNLPDWNSIIVRVRRPLFWQPSPVSKRMILSCNKC
jgi:hypothetical protein